MCCIFSRCSTRTFVVFLKPSLFYRCFLSGLFPRSPAAPLALLCPTLVNAVCHAPAPLGSASDGAVLPQKVLWLLAGRAASPLRQSWERRPCALLRITPQTLMLATCSPGDTSCALSQTLSALLSLCGAEHCFGDAGGAAASSRARTRRRGRLAGIAPVSTADAAGVSEVVEHGRPTWEPTQNPAVSMGMPPDAAVGTSCIQPAASCVGCHGYCAQLGAPCRWAIISLPTTLTRPWRCPACWSS